MPPSESTPSADSPVGSLQLTAQPSTGGWLVSGSLYVHDRPGELADVCSMIAGYGATIERFFYNRSENPSMVSVCARVPAGEAAGLLADEFQRAGRFGPAPVQRGDEAEVTDSAGLLRIKVNIEHRPGSLAAFATILKEHRANVLYLSYDAKKPLGLLEMAMATESPDEVSALLGDLDRRGYHYHVDWQGAPGSAIGDIIGLNAVERFLLNLKAVLPRDRLHELTDLIRSSKELQETLLRFRREAGGSDESMAASEIFTKILELATSSISKTGAAFCLQLAGPVAITEQVTLYMLTCPTGANSYLLRAGQDYTLIDSGYGLYYPDAKTSLAGHGIDASRIRNALFTHADADHAGWAAHLERDFGTAIFIHPDSLGIFQHENRAYGSDSHLMALNALFTKLANRFTDLHPPRSPRGFPSAEGSAGDFQVIGSFPVGDIQLLVLKSHGGHVPGQVFFYAPPQGLLFSGDYLIDFASLSERDKTTLSIPRFLMTSTNADTQVFGRELRKLAELMMDTQARLQEADSFARVFPGHGRFYRVDDASEMLTSLIAHSDARPARRPDSPA